MGTALLLASLGIAGGVGAPSGTVHTRPAAAAHTASSVPHFIENDFGAALKRARARDRPLFVEAWAPW